MIIGTAGSRVINREKNEVRRRTLLEVVKGDDTDSITNEPTTRRRAMSDTEPTNFVKDIRFEDIDVRNTERRKDQRNPAVRYQDVPLKTIGSSFTMPELDFQTAWKNIVSEKDVKETTTIQRQTLRKFEETNEMLRHFNLLSESTFIELQKQYQSHVQILCSLKGDLEQIFRRLRSLKEKMKEKYPEAVEATIETVKILKERQMMEMEYEVHKYSNMDDGIAPSELLPTYSNNPDTLTGRGDITDSNERSPTVRLKYNTEAEGDKKNQFVESDNKEESENNELEFITTSNTAADFPAGNEREFSEKSGVEIIGLREESTQFDELQTSIASTTECLEVNQTKDDTKSNIETLSQNVNELDIKAECFSQEEMSLGSYIDENQTIDNFESIGITNQNDSQEMATCGQKCDSEQSKINGSLNKQEDEIKTVTLSQEQKEEELIN